MLLRANQNPELSTALVITALGGITGAAPAAAAMREQPAEKLSPAAGS